MRLLRKFLEWLEEDAPYGDRTSELLIPRDLSVRACVIAKSPLIVAAIEDLAEVLEFFGIDVKLMKKSGERAFPGDVIMELNGRARDILLVESTLLNVLSYLFGVATTTEAFVSIAKSVNPKVRIAATRKTPPGLRELVKKAVEIGGGDTHRFGLSDCILIKDNHVAVLGISECIRRAKKASFVHKIEVEVRSLEEAVEAINSGADAVMLDNTGIERAEEIISALRSMGLREKIKVELSGGITLKNVEAASKLDVDVISSSEITMNPKPVDISLEIVEVLE